jgi:hypothetical protein
MPNHVRLYAAPQSASHGTLRYEGLVTSHVRLYAAPQNASHGTLRFGGLVTKAYRSIMKGMVTKVGGFGGPFRPELASFARIRGG